ncbi:MAG: hypothetical protein EAX90_10455 [Candidatus Heimdallarchaeota archaeon]|nr:hypothetical protein [Candidatus Heimdallarchaeota archaeon]
MSLKKIDVRRKIYSQNQHHTNVLKKIVKMQSKSSTAGNLLANEINNGSDILSTLFYLFLESIQDLNEDKKYFLEKLRQYNELSKAMGDYLKELNEITIEVNNTNKNDENYNEETLVSNTIRRIDKMIEAVNTCNSILSSSREERANDAKALFKQLNTNVLEIKRKLKQKKSIDTTVRKPDYALKKIMKKK